MSTSRLTPSKAPFVAAIKSPPARQGSLLYKSMEKTFRRLSKPSARHAYAEAEAITRIAHQIRVVRQQRGWTQAELAKRLGTTQAAVSRLEDPSYGKVSVSTLLQLARVFDVALQVRFVSFVKQVRSTWVVKREDLEVPSFQEEEECVGFWSEASSYVRVIENDSSNSAQIQVADNSAKLFFLSYLSPAPVSGANKYVIAEVKTE